MSDHDASIGNPLGHSASPLDGFRASGEAFHAQAGGGMRIGQAAETFGWWRGAFLWLAGTHNTAK